MKYLITYRRVAYWKNKKMCYRVPLKGKIIADSPTIYAPYIPIYAFKDTNGHDSSSL